MRLSILNLEPESICRMPSTSETLELKPMAPGWIHSVLPRAMISLILTILSEKSKINLLFTNMKEQLFRNVHLIISLLTLQDAMQSGLAPFLSWLWFLLLVLWQRKDWSRLRSLQSSVDVGLREAWVSLLQSWIQKIYKWKEISSKFWGNLMALFAVVEVWFLQSGLQFMSRIVSHRRIAMFGGYFVYAFVLWL